MSDNQPDPKQMTPREYGRWLARQAPPITDEQAYAAARILATVKPGEGRPWPEMDALAAELREKGGARPKPVAGDGT